MFCDVIMLCFSDGVGGVEGSVGVGAPRGSQTQSALRKGLLDLIQHIPKQCWLITLCVNGHGLTRLENKVTK